MIQAWKAFKSRIRWRYVLMIGLCPFAIWVLLYLFGQSEDILSEMILILIVDLIFVFYPLGSLFLKFCTYMDVYGHEPETAKDLK